MIAWSIAGSDSGGGAGIQADLKTYHGLGVHGCTIITALTAQNTREVRAAQYVAPELIQQQIDVLREDLPARAVKSGMLGSAAIIELVAAALQDMDVFYVCDPVMVSTSGARLLDANAEAVLKKRLLPRVDLLTPNLPEAEVLCGYPIGDTETVEKAAHDLVGMGTRAVLIKGGHGETGFSQDYFYNGVEGWWLTSRRIETYRTHGTGCTLSAAITAFKALGMDLADALVLGRAYVAGGIRQAGPIGSGHGPVHQGGHPADPLDMPWLTDDAAAGCRRPRFPDCGPPLGLYPLVDRAAKLQPLIAAGVTTAQLRIKDLTGDALEQELTRAIAAARAGNLRLFINDHWEAALKLGAYGVHLGQEDLAEASIDALLQGGLRLGISTHNYAELARANAYRPSYVAVGPVFHTKSKEVAAYPQGLERLAQRRKLIAGPLVAIGGIDLTRVSAVLNAGADGIAVMGALANVADSDDVLQQWLELF